MMSHLKIELYFLPNVLNISVHLGQGRTWFALDDQIAMALHSL